MTFRVSMASSPTSSDCMDTPKYIALHAKFLIMPHDEAVRNLGAAQPFKNEKFPPIKVAVLPDAVVLDGRGNVTSMPPLIGRPCFGRVEYFLRHRHKYPRTKIIGEDKREVKNSSRCDLCPVRAACAKVVAARVKSDINLMLTVKDCFGPSLDRNEPVTFTGQVGQNLWQPVLTSIIGVGPWQTSNDEHVRIVVENHRANQLRKWRDFSQKRRAAAVRNNEPDQWVIDQAPAERVRRYAALLKMCGPSAAHDRLKSWSGETCTSVARTWFVWTMLRAQRKKHGCSHIARYIIESGEDTRSWGAMRQRVLEDMKKIEHLYRVGAWQEAYDPCGPNYDPDLCSELEAAGITLLPFAEIGQPVSISAP